LSPGHFWFSNTWGSATVFFFVKTDAYEARMDPIPALGQHTDAVSAEIGYSRTEIEGLRNAGANLSRRWERATT
jgi:crotonobetainyl-CoA:carnitine CoA-transferase CaiB-like acyl-CoA transferase